MVMWWIPRAMPHSLVSPANELCRAWLKGAWRPVVREMGTLPVEEALPVAGISFPLRVTRLGASHRPRSTHLAMPNGPSMP